MGLERGWGSLYVHLVVVDDGMSVRRLPGGGVTVGVMVQVVQVVQEVSVHGPEKEEAGGHLMCCVVLCCVRV